jgi:regulator of replication initiation timing
MLQSQKYKVIKYERLVPVIIGAVQDLQKDNKDLRLENEELRARLDSLEATVSQFVSCSCT